MIVGPLGFVNGLIGLNTVACFLKYHTLEMILSRDTVLHRYPASARRLDTKIHQYSLLLALANLLILFPVSA